MKYTTLGKLVLFLLLLGLGVYLARTVTWHDFITPIRRGFYSVCTMAIFFYTACALRQIARYFRAKTDRLRDI